MKFTFDMLINNKALIEVIYYVLTCIGVFTAILQLAFLMAQSWRGNQIRCNQSTIDYYNQIYDASFAIKKKVEEAMKASGNSFVDVIVNTPDLESKVLQQLTLVESFSAGLECKIYNKKMFETLTCDEIVELFENFVRYVDTKRAQTEYTLLFNNFRSMVIDMKSFQAKKKSK